MTKRNAHNNYDGLQAHPPSISQPLKTMDFIKNRIVDISIKGDHVACLVPRSNIVVTSAVAVAVLDAYLEGVGYR